MLPQVAVGELGAGEADAAQRRDEHVGHRGEPQPQLVGAHGGGAGAIGEEVELAFLDAVLHLAAGAVREACAAYILSQKHEGWIALTGRYDDGGYSGGSMDRDDLQRRAPPEVPPSSYIVGSIDQPPWSNRSAFPLDFHRIESVSVTARRHSSAAGAPPDNSLSGPSVSTRPRSPRRLDRRTAIMPKLSDTQAVLLTAAAARPDLSLLPVPDTIRLNGAALDRTLKSLLSRGFIAEKSVSGHTRRSKWATNPLVITAAGLAAIGIEVPEAAADPAADAQTSQPQPVAAGRPERPAGKMGVVLDAVARPKGATLDELTTASGWLPHTTRAALTRLRQRGFNVRLATTGARKAYHLVPAA